MFSRINDAEITYNEFDFKQIKEYLTNSGREIIFPEGIIVKPSPNEIFFIMQGNIVIQDNQEKSTAIGQGFPFMPVGLLERYYNDTELFYRADSIVKVKSLTFDEFDKLASTSPELTQSIIQILSHMIINLVHVYYERNTDTRYSVIRNMIYRYTIKNSNNTLQEQNITTFILQRTQLSRSYIFKVISELKSGGYITIEKGKLISINKNIPERY